MKQLFLLASNLAVMSAWTRVVYVFATNRWEDLVANREGISSEILRPSIIAALAVSSIELLTSLLGLTRSKPWQVLLFMSVRTGVELLLAPILSYGAWQHLMTALCWSVGDSIRFGCFALDNLSQEAGLYAKSVRYTVGPILFPLGATGEMLMVIRAAQDGRPYLYLAAALWPVGFYPLITQLLKQRQRHFQRLRDSKENSKKKE